MLYKSTEWISSSGKVHIQCEDLVGTGTNWITPSRILEMQVTDFILMLKNEYNANIVPYKKDGKISFIGYSWDSLTEARKYKNMINRVAREKKFQI